MEEKVKKEVREVIKHCKLGFSIYEFRKRINWNLSSIYETFTEDSIREFKDEINWSHVSWGGIGRSKRIKLSENFIREFKDKVDWYYISDRQKLSENFIREFKDKVYWNKISNYQILSKKFIYEFKEKINIDVLIQRKLIAEGEVKQIERNKAKQKLYLNNKKINRFEIMDI